MGVKMNLNPVMGDGVETHFNLGWNADIYHLGTPLIYLDGVLKTVTTDYTITGYVVTFVTPPGAGVVVQGDYSTLDRN